MLSNHRKIDRIIRLLKAGYTDADVGNKLGVTRQAISARVRSYYKNSHSNEYRTYILVRTCKICSIEQEIETKIVLYTEMKSITKLDKPIFYSYQKRPHICDDCQREHLVRCSYCGSIGRAGKEFLPMPKKLKYYYNHLCNRLSAMDQYYKNKEPKLKASKNWFLKNPNYMAERRKRLIIQGLCGQCGKANDSTEGQKICASCRAQNNLCYKKRHETTNKIL
jgi:hypothetical protein